MSKAKSKKNDSKYPWKYTPFFTEGMPEDLDYLSILMFGSVLMRTRNYKNRSCSVSVGNLASELKVSRKTVSLRLKKLLELGMIEKIGWSNGGTNVYKAVDSIKWKSIDTISQKDVWDRSERQTLKSEIPIGYVTEMQGVGQRDIQEEVIEESTEEQVKESLEDYSNNLISKDSFPVNNSEIESDNLVFVDISKNKVFEGYGNNYPVFEENKMCPRCGILESIIKNKILQCGRCGYPVNAEYDGIVNAAYVMLSD